MTFGRVAFLTIISVLALGVLAACGDSGDDTPAPPSQPASPTQAAAPPPAPPAADATPTEAAMEPSDSDVSLDIVNFTHQDQTVSVGETVAWQNGDSAPHTTTSGEPGARTDTWDSGSLQPGGTFSFRFEEAGTFSYFCTIHPTMRASITVEGEMAEEPSATPSPAPVPTATSVPPTPTAVPPTATAVPPTAPAVPPTAVPPTATPEASAGPEPRSVDTVQFRHPNITVQVGTEVTWTNQDGAPHTVTSGLPGSMTGLFRSGTMSGGAAFSFTFDQAGSFQYFCEIHPSMQATVTVTE